MGTKRGVENRRTNRYKTNLRLETVVSEEASGNQGGKSTG